MGQRLTKRDIRLLQEDRRINAINFINNIVKEKDELQSMIDKAIAYIETGKTFLSDETRETVEYMQNILLDILKGSDTNEQTIKDNNKIKKHI